MWTTRLMPATHQRHDRAQRIDLQTAQAAGQASPLGPCVVDDIGSQLESGHQHHDQVEADTQLRDALAQPGTKQMDQ